MEALPLAYRTVGQGPQALVILHGVFGSGDNWMTVSKAFDAEYTCYLLDQRNHGKSPHADTHNYEGMVADLLQFVKEHQLAPIVLVGHSMGGKVAMFFASQYPDLVSKLVIVDIAPRAYRMHHMPHIEAMEAIASLQPASRAEADTIMAQYVKEVDTRQFLLKNLQRTDEGFVWKINVPVLKRDLTGIGRELPVGLSANIPTLWIRGALSYYIRPEDEARIMESFPDSQIVTIADAGHWVQAEQPKAFADVLNAFLAR